MERNYLYLLYSMLSLEEVSTEVYQSLQQMKLYVLCRMKVGWTLKWWKYSTKKCRRLTFLAMREKVDCRRTTISAIRTRIYLRN